MAERYYSAAETGGALVGRPVRWLGASLLVVGLVGGLALAVLRREPGMVGLEWLGWLQPFALLAGALLLYRGKQLAAHAQSQAASEIIAATPPVLYLRPFKSDESSWGQILGVFLAAKAYTGLASVEEQLAAAVAPIGPLVGIGEPAESRPKPGAARIYTAHWQERVAALLRGARLVILRPGASTGVLWEMQQAFQCVSPDRLLIMLMGVKKKDYVALRATLAELVGISLPRFEEVRRWRRANAFLAFEPNWRIRVLPLRAPLWRGSVRNPLRHVLKYALRPVFEQLGVGWQPSRIFATKVILFGFTGLLFSALPFVYLAWFFDNLSDVQDARPASLPAEPAPLDSAAAIEEPAPRLVAGLVITAPGTLEPVELGLPAAARANFDTVESYLLTDQEFMVAVSRFDIRPDVVPSLMGCAQGIVQNASRTPGISEFRFTTSSATVRGLPAIKVDMTFAAEGATMISEALCFGLGQRMWNVMALGSQTRSDQVRQTIASVSPEPSPPI